MFGDICNILQIYVTCTYLLQGSESCPNDGKDALTSYTNAQLSLAAAVGDVTDAAVG